MKKINLFLTVLKDEKSRIEMQHLERDFLLVGTLCGASHHMIRGVYARDRANQVVEYLPCKCETLSSNPIPLKKERKRNRAKLAFYRKSLVSLIN
jgi:hypothetical protein